MNANEELIENSAEVPVYHDLALSGGGYPSPSFVDKSGWINLANKRQDGRPVLAIIVGRKGLHVELINREGNAMVMHGELE